jgi:hypothetical protein
MRGVGAGIPYLDPEEVDFPQLHLLMLRLRFLAEAGLTYLYLLRLVVFTFTCEIDLPFLSC